MIDIEAVQTSKRSEQMPRIDTLMCDSVEKRRYYKSPSKLAGFVFKTLKNNCQLEQNVFILTCQSLKLATM